MALTVAPEVKEAEKRKRMRSPAYPFINLETAIKRAKEFYEKEGRNPAPLKVAVKHWGYEEKSSGGLQTAAALISFGLMQDEGTGDKRKLKLTTTALGILLDERPNSDNRVQAIKAAALTPKIHQQIWRRWGDASDASDANIKHMLILELDPPFNPNTAEAVIKEYRDTIAFSKPDSSVTVPLADGDLKAESAEEVKGEGKRTAGKSYTPKIGDYVQWEPKGILQFQEPKRITGISADGAFAFVDGNGTGLLVDELTLQAKPATASAVNLTLSSEKHAMRQDVFSLAEGTVTIQWPTPLSTDSITDLKDWLKIVERKITRSTATTEEQKGSDAE